MILKSVTLKPGLSKEKVEELCDLLRQAELFHSVSLGGDNRYRVTLQFDNPKQFRVVCAALKLDPNEAQ